MSPKDKILVNGSRSVWNPERIHLLYRKVTVLTIIVHLNLCVIASTLAFLFSANVSLVGLSLAENKIWLSRDKDDDA